MNNMGVKKWLSFLLAAAFVLGMIPLGTQKALADESVDVTLAVNDAAYGTLTSNPSELSGLAPGVQATLTATALKGYEFGSWSVTDGDGAATEDYTLVPDKSVQGKAVLTLGATDLIVTAVFKSILEGDGNFVNSANKDKPKVQINQGSTILSTTSITGWNNSTAEPLVVTFTVPRDLRELGNLQVWIYTKLMTPTPTYLAAEAYYTFPDTSIEDATTVRKLTFTAEDWNWSEYAFTITDVDGKVKPGKMIFKYAGLADIEAEHGGVSIESTLYHTGDAHYFGTQGLVNDWKGILATVEAVPDAGYVFDEWEISGVSLGDASANPLTFTTPDAQPFSVRAKFTQIPRYMVSFMMMNGEENLTAWSNWTGKFGGIPYSLYLFDKDATFDEMLASPYSGVSQHADTTKDVQEYSIEQGGRVLFILHSYPAKGEYILDDIVTDAQASDILGRVSIEDDIVRDGLIYRNGKAYLALTITGDVSVTANVHESAYTEIDTACDAAQGSVSITPAASTANLWLEGTKVMMRAAPKTGYRFKEWQEVSEEAYLNQDQLTQSVVEFTVGEIPASFTAVFESAVSELRSVNKAASAADKATVLVNGSAQTGKAYEGSTVAISYADIDEYYLFDHWEVYQEGVSGAVNLIPLVDREKKDVSFIMPYGEQGVRVTAVLKLRPYASLTCSIRESGGGQLAGVGSFAMSADGVPVSSGVTVEKGKTILLSAQVVDPAYVFKCWRIFKDKEGASGVQVKIFESEESEISYEMPWYHLYVWAVFEPKTPLNTNYDIALVQPDGGHAIAAGAQTARPTKTVTLSATPAEGYQVKQWTVVLDANGTAVTVTPSQTNKNEATFVMPVGAVTVSAEFEEEPPAEAKIVDVQLLDGDGGLIAQGALAMGTKAWTIELPGTIDAAVAQAIPEGLSGLCLKVVVSQDATVRQNDEGYGSYDDATGSSGSWASGSILCYMPLNQTQTFTVTARGGELSDEYTITILYNPGMPALSGGSAERTSDAAATVRFTSSEAGTYYYAVVNAGAAAPTVNTTTGGTSAVAGENTIALTNLTAGARDIYIVVKNAQGGMNEPYRVSIPAFAGTGTLYDISVSAPAGGTIAVSPARAAAGATVTVTVSPDAGKQMVAGSLTYTIAVAGGQTHAISGNTFVMPANPVTITCQWETVTAAVSGITGFSINGVQGVVNNSTGTITITMPYRTDVTALAPAIATNDVSALTPGSGETLDFSSPITYTATLTGGGTRTYIATVYVQSGGTADEMWDELTDFYNQVPWWRFAEEQYSYGRYPRYW